MRRISLFEIRLDIQSWTFYQRELISAYHLIFRTHDAFVKTFHIYIYIYMCVCVCVCVFKKGVWIKKRDGY